MARGPATFKQADLVRALRAAKAVGYEVVEFDLSNGRFKFVAIDVKTPGEANYLDRELAEFEARHAG